MDPSNSEKSDSSDSSISGDDEGEEEEEEEEEDDEDEGEMDYLAPDYLQEDSRMTQMPMRRSLLNLLAIKLAVSFFSFFFSLFISIFFCLAIVFLGCKTLISFVFIIICVFV